MRIRAEEMFDGVLWYFAGAVESGECRTTENAEFAGNDRIHVGNLIESKCK